MVEQLIPPYPLRWVYHQHFPNYILDGLWDFVWEDQRLFFYLFEQIDYVGGSVGHLAKDHLVEADSYRPDVCLDIIGLAVQHFRGHIERRPQDSLDLLILGAQQFGEPEVSQLDDAIVLEDVGELEIAMHDLALDEGLKSMEDLHEILDCLVFGDLLLELEVGAQVALVAVLEDEVDVVDGLLDVDEADDVVILAGLEDLDLVVEELGELACVEWEIPLILARLMVLMATSVPSILLQPRKTSPNCPEPIFFSRTQMSTALGMFCGFLNKQVRVRRAWGLSLIEAAGIYYFNMAEIKIQTIEKNFDSILQLVGSESFVKWDAFSQSSSQVVTSIDQLNRTLAIFRDSQHRNFIQTMKKLKSLDLPDLIAAVKNKRLPKEALRGVLPRFKLGEGDKIELVESKETLKEHAIAAFQEYESKNTIFVEELKKFTEFVDNKIKESGYVPEVVPEFSIKATVKFNLDESKASQLASDIKIENIPGTSMIGLNTYKQIVDSSFNLIKTEYERVTKEARVKQRQNLKDNAEYLKTMNEYLVNSEALIIEGQTLLAKKLGLPDKKLEESEILMMERGLGQHMLMLQSQLRGKIKQSIPAGQDVAFEVAKEVIEFQTKMIGDKTEEIKKILEGLERTQETIQTIPMLLALILNDMVYEKYGFEEEDFMKNVSEEVISTNPELVKIFRDMEISIIKLMQSLGVIPPEVGKAMEQSAAQRGEAIQGQPQQQQQMFANGPLPHSNNPLDMLQMQQMQQMQQMYSQMQPPK